MENLTQLFKELSALPPVDCTKQLRTYSYNGKFYKLYQTELALIVFDKEDKNYENEVKAYTIFEVPYENGHIERIGIELKDVVHLLP